MHVELNDAGIQVGRHRTARLMRANALKARQKTRCQRTTDKRNPSDEPCRHCQRTGS